VRRLRLLRSPRPRPGQVRDASARTGGRAADHRECRGVRVVAPFVLPGSVGVRPGRTRRTASEETGTATLSQAELGDRRVSRGAAVRGCVVALGGARRARAGALRAQRSSAQHRTGPGPAEKKTATMISEPGDSAGAVTAYEQLRAHVLEGTTAGVFGL